MDEDYSAPLRLVSSMNFKISAKLNAAICIETEVETAAVFNKILKSTLDRQIPSLFYGGIISLCIGYEQF